VQRQTHANILNIEQSAKNTEFNKRNRNFSLQEIMKTRNRAFRSATRFTCTRCWLRTFCKLCLSEELNNLINIDKAVTALYSRVELTHSRKAKQWQRDHRRVEARTYTEWQQRLCIHVAAHIQHIHIYCEGTTQLLRTYRQTWCSKSIDFSHFQADLHAAQSHTEQ